MGRVFDADDRADDSTVGLILFCKDWVKPDFVMAEIGCYRGVSTSIFAQYAKTVHAVDPWMLNFEHYKELPYEMLSTAEGLFDQKCLLHPNIVKHKGLSVEVAKEFQDGSLDMVYIDGDHSEAAMRADMESWVPKVKKGGLVTGHDWCLIGTIVNRPVKIYPDQSWVYEKSE